MATFINLLQGTTKDLIKEAYDRQRFAEESRALEYKSAVKIQKWYRGISTRQYLKHLSAAAVIIQKTWRGYMGRIFCRIRIRNLVMIMRMNFYNASAVTIQKRWRGYYVRKYVHNFFARKRYLEALAIKNQIVRSELDEIKEQLDLEANRREQESLEKRLQIAARRNHYLVSTKQKPGIYNSPFREAPHEMEFRLRAAKPLSMKPRVFPRFASGIVDDAAPPMKPSPPKDGLPPIKDKIQGPFKPLEKVRKQRYRPLNPSLRVSTDFNSLELERAKMKREEWVKRLHDKSFVPFTQHETSYEPLLHTDSEYLIDFGNKFCMREDQPEFNVSSRRMRTVVSPIPVFDKLGSAYTKGAVLLH